MIALELPDEPRWVLAHGIAADPTSWHEPHVAVGNARAKLAVALPGAAPAALLARVPADHAIVVATPDLPAARITLFTLPDPSALPDLEGAVLVDDPPPGYTAPTYGAYVDDELVAFACATWRSAAYFDVSVDVVPRARQLGLGTLVAAALIRAETRAPVLGAPADDLAAHRLAARLGFVATDTLYLVPPR